MNYVYAGYGITFAALALYSIRVLARGRALRRVLPELPQLPPGREERPS